MTACASTNTRESPAGALRAIIAADNARDLDAVCKQYTEDVVWLPPDGTIITGKRAVRDRYRTMYDKYDVRLEATIEELEVADTLAYVRGVTTGRLTPRDGSGAADVRDRFLAVLRYDNGRWRVARLMWSPTARPSPD